MVGTVGKWKRYLENADSRCSLLSCAVIPYNVLLFAVLSFISLLCDVLFARTVLLDRLSFLHCAVPICLAVRRRTAVSCGMLVLCSFRVLSQW